MILRLLMLALCFVSLPAYAASPQPVFHGFVWGVSPQDVQRFETAMLYDAQDNMLSFFEDTKEGRKIYRYDFNNKKLWRIRVTYQELYRPVPKQILDLAADDKAALQKEYGTPDRDQLIWSDNYYRRYGKLFERAFAMGLVRIEAEWHRDQTRILFDAYKGEYAYEIRTIFEKRDASKEADQAFEFLKYNE